MPLQYSSDNAITWTSVNSLGNSATAVCSSAAVIPSTTNNVVDHIVTCQIASPATYTASASTVVNIFAYASADGTNWDGSGTTNELVDGTDKAITWSTNGNNARFVGSIIMPATTSGTSITYRKNFNMAAVFGTLPRRYVLVAQNQTGAALPASGHAFEYAEVFYN